MAVHIITKKQGWQSFLKKRMKFQRREKNRGTGANLATDGLHILAVTMTESFKEALHFVSLPHLT
jgi:hypothetical protein